MYLCEMTGAKEHIEYGSPELKALSFESYNRVSVTIFAGFLQF